MFKLETCPFDNTECASVKPAHWWRVFIFTSFV